MLIDDIASYLEVENIGTVGTDIFKANQPANPVRNITIFDTGGQAPDVDLIGVENPTIQLISRGENYSEAMTLARAAYAVLHGLTNTDIGDAYVMFCAAVQPPQMIGQDENNNYEISCNYSLKVR
jgi:Bacteriophage minor capsid protein